MNSRKVVGFCNLHTSPKIGGLNEKRALGAVTFLGRFAIMDFTLSNFSNSGIDGVCILVHRFPHSVLGHVESGDVWTANTKTGFEYTFFNEFGVNDPESNTDINNILANLGSLKKVKDRAEYVVIAPVHYLTSMDFRPIIDQHIEKNSKVTCVYVPIHDGKTNFTKSTLVNLNDDGSVKSFKLNNKAKDEINVSLETFVITGDVFADLVLRAQTIDKTFSIADMISYMIKNENLKVDTYRFEHYVIPIMSLDEYVNNSFSLLKFENRRKLFRHDWPIYTRTHDTPPAYYGPHSSVKDSIISNGCKIYGKVEHSILSRNVVVNKGANLSNCIVFTDSIIGPGVKIKHVVTDKNVLIEQDMEGKEEKPLFLKTGSKV